MTVRVILPQHLRTLAQSGREVELNVEAPVTLTSVLDTLEQAYPRLRGTIREYGTLKRRSLIRFFALGKDISHEPAGDPLPAAIATGAEPLWVVGAIAGG